MKKLKLPQMKNQHIDKILRLKTILRYNLQKITIRCKFYFKLAFRESFQGLEVGHGHPDIEPVTVDQIA